MNSADFTIELATWATDLDALRSVREPVFVIEQQVSREEEWDDLDSACDHVLARDATGVAIGTGRLTPQRKIGRMAVLAHWRGKGVGAAMLRTLIERARERGWPEVDLHAQISALGFYERHGFEAYGDEFVEANIRHRHMRLTLTALEAAPRQRGIEPEPPEARDLATNNRDDVKSALVALLDDARHSVCVHSRDLDPGILDDVDVLIALRRLAGSGRGASLRFLLHNPAKALRDGHRLIALAQKLPSAVQMRVPVEEDDLAYPSAFTVNDVGGYLMRPLASRFDGRGSTCERDQHGPLSRYFDEVWERSENAAELRSLGI